MNKEKKLALSEVEGLIPELRFPDFKDEGEWNECELGELCDYWNGASHENGVSENGDYYLISLNSIDIDGNLKKEMKRLSYTDNSLQENDLVMVLSDVAHGNLLGLTDIIPNEKYVLNQRMAGLRVKDDKQSNSFFIRAYINKNQKYFKSKGQGSSQLNLSKSSVTGFPVKIPKNPAEQQKIASCLSSLDEVIAAHSQKLELLKDHKKGLMQNLFPQEGEKVPKFRFKEFENEGEWIETVIGSVVEMKGRIGYRGYTTEDIVDKGKGAITLSPSNFDANGQLNFDKCTYISWAKYEESPEIQLEEGQTVLVKTASVGKTAYVDKLPEKATVNPQIVVLKPKKIYNKFLSYTIAHQNTQIQISNCVGAGAIPNISQEIISKIKIILPPDIKKREQQKIALCLSSLDEVISAQSQKLDSLKEHKKGLMQSLFPKIID